jgi:hypothetical protein
MVNQAANIPIGFAVRQNYNYRLFWEECPSYGHSECSVKAETDNGLLWSWKYRKAKLSDLGSQITANNPVAVDSSTEFALWDCQHVKAINQGVKNHKSACHRCSLNRH